MASFPSEADGCSVYTFNSQTSTSSQPTQTSLGSSLDTPRLDPVQAAIMTSISNFLGAQHTTREVGALRRQTNETLDQVNVSMAFLRQELSHHKEESAKTLSDLNQGLMAMQQSLEAKHTTSSSDLQAVQGQYRSAFEKIEFLQGELKEMRAEKFSTEAKLAALERKVATEMQPLREISVEKLAFLDQIHSRYNELVKLLDNPPVDNKCIHLSPAIVMPQPAQRSQLPPPTITQMIQESGAGFGGQQEGVEHARTQNLGVLLQQFKNEFDTNPPRSEVAFIWKFIDAIESLEVSRYVQESLINLFPELVTKKRQTRRKADNRYINIPATLTWNIFWRAVVTLPPLY